MPTRLPWREVARRVYASSKEGIDDAFNFVFFSNLFRIPWRVRSFPFLSRPPPVRSCRLCHAIVPSDILFASHKTINVSFLQQISFSTSFESAGVVLLHIPLRAHARSSHSHIPCRPLFFFVHFRLRVDAFFSSHV